MTQLHKQWLDMEVSTQQLLEDMRTNWQQHDPRRPVAVSAIQFRMTMRRRWKRYYNDSVWSAVAESAVAGRSAVAGGESVLVAGDTFAGGIVCASTPASGCLRMPEEPKAAPKEEQKGASLAALALEVPRPKKLVAEKRAVALSYRQVLGQCSQCHGYPRSWGRCPDCRQHFCRQDCLDRHNCQRGREVLPQ